MSLLNKTNLDIMQCLYCHSKLNVSENHTSLCCPSCGVIYPIVNNIPIIIKEGESLFSTDSFLSRADTTYATPQSRIASFIFKYLPTAELNVNSKRNYTIMATMLNKNASVLVIGGGIDGYGFETIRNRTDLNIVCVDVSILSSTNIIADGHNLPFSDNVFQAVILQAVLEHVVNPHECVNEAYRVLSPCGLLYAETPFMQQVHMGAYDFQRFTSLGHRRLFARFQEISSGVACGAGSALCWALIYFLQSFTSSRKIKTLLHILGRLLFFPLKYFDYITHATRGTVDCASGFYFLGTKSDTTLSDAELVCRYRGLC